MTKELTETEINNLPEGELKTWGNWDHDLQRYTPKNFLLTASDEDGEISGTFFTIKKVFYNETTNRYLYISHYHGWRNERTFKYLSEANLSWIKWDYVSGALVEILSNHKDLNPKKIPTIFDTFRRDLTEVKHIWENFYEVVLVYEDKVFIFDHEPTKEMREWQDRHNKFLSI